MFLKKLKEKNKKELCSQSCSDCIHLSYNSDGSVECAEEYYHRCNMKARIKYKRKTQ